MKQKLKWIALAILLLLLAALGFLAATFKVPEFAGLDDIQIQGMEGKEVAANISAKIYNPNFYALGARRLDYIVSYHDTIIGKGELPNGLSLVSGDTSHLELPLKLQLEGIFAVYKSMLRKTKCVLDVHLEGVFTFLNYHQGLDISTEVEPGKFIQDVLGSAMGSDDLSIEEMKWKSTNLKASEISFVSVVKNPLDIPLDLKQFQIQLYNEGSTNKAGEWKLAKPLTLQAKYSTRMPGSIVLNHLNAGLGVATTVLTGEMRLDAKGLMILQLASLPFEIPIEGKMVIQVSHPKIMRFEG